MIHIPKTRLEAFSDGVIAIIITIMVLEIKVPHGTELAVLKPLLSVFLSYVLSFIYVGIYWNNHHHLLHAAKRINGKIMWANLHLLFWLSLVPFATGWLGENHGETWPTAIYGSILLMAGVAYLILQKLIISSHGENTALVGIFSKDWKGKLSLLSYAAAIGLAFMNKWISDVIYVCVAMMWLIPDRRIERLPSE
jgi:uncharacterized membrane protein